MQGEEISGELSDGKAFKSYAANDPDLIKLLTAKKVDITAKPKDENSWYTTFLISWLPMLVLVGIWIFFMRQMQAGGGKAMSFGKSRARLMTENTVKITFADVAGIEEAKEEVSEIIDFLKDPKKFTRLGGRIPKGVLLVGAPGTGKTLLARAIAGEAGRALLQHQRLRLRRDVRRRRRRPGAGPLHPGQEERPLHHLYR